ncbi:MAG: tRNA-guanine transglycosylase [Candidatus Helarchaeota archaeon]
MIKINQIEYKISNIDNLSRVGVIKLKNGKIIETPINWVGLSIAESIEFHLTAFKKAGVSNFLSNVFDLLYQDKKKKRARLIELLVKEGLFHKMDSGGFQLMKQELLKNKAFNLTPEIVYETQKKCNCDIGVILDVPIGACVNEKQDLKNIDKTMKNFERLLKIYDHLHDNFSILPVIHGYSYKMLDYALQKLESLISEPVKALGIGSLVPMVKSTKNSGRTGSKSNFIDILIYVRKKLPKTFIHTFGIGGTMAYLAFLCGVDSIDSNGWILKASRGVIQLPGISDRFLRKKKHNRPYLIKNRKIRGTNEIINEIELFMNCQCPACIEYYKEGNWTYNDWKKKCIDFDQYNELSRLKRVIHNLWLYQNELKLMKDAIKSGKIQDFIEKRLRFSVYKKLYSQIITNLNKNQVKIESYFK